jgi:hypothetical protein
MNTRLAIFLEMFILWSGGMLVQYQGDLASGKDTHARTYMGDLFIGRGLQSGVWIVVLGGVLLAASELTDSDLVAKFGFMIVASTLMVEFVYVSAGLQSLMHATPSGSGENIIA